MEADQNWVVLLVILHTKTALFLLFINRVLPVYGDYGSRAGSISQRAIFLQEKSNEDLLDYFKTSEIIEVFIQTIIGRFQIIFPLPATFSVYTIPQLNLQIKTTCLLIYIIFCQFHSKPQLSCCEFALCSPPTKRPAKTYLLENLPNPKSITYLA